MGSGAQLGTRDAASAESAPKLSVTIPPGMLRVRAGTGACPYGSPAPTDARLSPSTPRAYKRTTVPGEDPVDSPDLIGRDFDPASGMPGERLVGDITYLKTGEGWLYLP
jgi:hypothetical protein